MEGLRDMTLAGSYGNHVKDSVLTTYLHASNLQLKRESQAVNWNRLLTENTTD